MASVQANLEVQKIFLSQERGDRRAQPAMELANASMQTEKMLAPLEDSWANMKAGVMTGFHDLFQLAGPLLEKAPEYIDVGMEYLKKMMFWVDWDKRKREAEAKGQKFNEEFQRFTRNVRKMRRREGLD